MPKKDKKPLLYRKPDYHRALPIITFVEREWRQQFRRDYARLLHSPAFRRLQGKTQLFSGLESDFFRNRLTHSLEVAQIAKSIALKINCEHLAGHKQELNTELVEFAGLAHDLGHPPFGHTGETVLNDIMIKHGGFEGNAQTLRIVSRLEKKLDDPDTQLGDEMEPVWFADGEEKAVGLNLCSRTLASVLKYDREIPPIGVSMKVEKGYYASERGLVERIRGDVAPGIRPMKTIECQIMDLADDIAYSTYDIEDAFKAGLTDPLKLLYPDKELLAAVTKRCRKGLEDDSFTSDQAQAATWRSLDDFFKNDWEVADSLATSSFICRSGFFRNAFTSSLVRRFVDGVRFKYNQKTPSMSSIWLERSIHEEVETLKHFTYELMIQSNRLKMVAKRAEFIIRAIMDALMTPGGSNLLPGDFRKRYIQALNGGPCERHSAEESKLCMRVICDFVAGMTDKYAVEFFSRLRSETYQTIFRDY
jgi:dGTPase